MHNRDEFWDRETKPAGFWEDNNEILAGKDVLKGGTWLGVTKSGRMAALTNFRVKDITTEIGLSRGKVVVDFLNSDLSPHQYLLKLQQNAKEYSGFNLIVADLKLLYHESQNGVERDSVWYYSNRNNEDPKRVDAAGFHGLSNAFLDTPWPKVKKTKMLVKNHSANITFDTILQLMMDPETVSLDDPDLPNTGMDKIFEVGCSAAFVKLDQFRYGTRTSTWISLDQSGKLQFIEIDHMKNVRRTFEFQIDQ